MRRRLSAAAPRSAFELSVEQIAALGEGLPVVIESFLGAPAALDLRMLAERMAASGELRPAAVGRLGLHRHVPEVRRDLTAFLDLDDLPEAARPLHRGLTRVQQAVNEAAWLGLRRFDLQLALYPGTGAYYHRHRDAFVGQHNRRLTAIYYVNPGWTGADGGVLRCFTSAGAIDVEPRDDRLVIFLSERLEHEVMPVHAPRFAYTAWFYG